MNVASLDSCRELYELSGWDDSTFSWIPKDFFGHSGGTYGVTSGDYKLATGIYEDMETGELVQMLPAYDLGYLLRKLPTPTQITRALATYTAYTARYKALNEIVAVPRTDKTPPARFEIRADTPEDAAAKLAIELFRQGLLAPQEPTV